MIRVNGDSMEWREGLTVREILGRCHSGAFAVVVSVNDSVVPRFDFDQATVPNGAEVKVIQLADGG